MYVVSKFTRKRIQRMHKWSWTSTLNPYSLLRIVRPFLQYEGHNPEVVGSSSATNCDNSFHYVKATKAGPQMAHLNPRSRAQAQAQEAPRPHPAERSHPASSYYTARWIVPLTIPPSVVFVHGLTGDHEKTWTAHDESEPWPQTLLPSRLPTARILIFGYDASVVEQTL
ncbi:hypothetical protein PG990_014672 [Apiospora arundinis]